MSTPPSSPPTHLPTLTEVIDLGALPAVPRFEADAAWAPARGNPESAPVLVPASSPDAPFHGIDNAAFTQKVLGEVQRQIDGMLEYRLREAVAPVLSRVTEMLVRELRAELALTLRDVVSRAVAQELSRQRAR